MKLPISPNRISSIPVRKIVGFLVTGFLSLYDYETTRFGLALVVGGTLAMLGAAGVHIAIVQCASRLRTSRGQLVPLILLIALSVSGTSITFFANQGHSVDREQEVRALHGAVSAWSAGALGKMSGDLEDLDVELAKLKRRATVEWERGRGGRRPGRGPVYESIEEDRVATAKRREVLAHRIEAVRSLEIPGVNDPQVLRNFVTAAITAADGSIADPAPSTELSTEASSVPLQLAQALSRGDGDALLATFSAVLLDALLVMLLWSSFARDPLVRMRRWRPAWRREIEARVDALLAAWTTWRFSCLSSEEALRPLLHGMHLEGGQLLYKLPDPVGAFAVFIKVAHGVGLVELNGREVVVQDERVRIWSEVVAILIAIETRRDQRKNGSLDPSEAAAEVLAAAKDIADIKGLLETIEGHRA